MFGVFARTKKIPIHRKLPANTIISPSKNGRRIRLVLRRAIAPAPRNPRERLVDAARLRPQNRCAQCSLVMEPGALGAPVYGRSLAASYQRSRSSRGAIAKASNTGGARHSSKSEMTVVFAGSFPIISAVFFVLANRQAAQTRCRGHPQLPRGGRRACARHLACSQPKRRAVGPSLWSRGGPRHSL